MPYNYKTELERYRRYYQSLQPILGKPRVQNYTSVIFSFLVVSLFGLYAIRPTLQTILTLRREIRDKTEISQKMEDKIAALIEAQANYSQVEASLPFVDQALPDSPEAIPLIIQLRNLASIVGVTLVSVQLPAVPLLGGEATPAAKPKTIQTAGNQQAVDFSIGITGPYTAIQAFIGGIQEMRRIVTIQSISVSTGASAPQQDASGSAVPIGQQLQLNLKLLSYYLIQ